MATIDLGKIKLVWRGTYNNSTAYTVDDVVEYTDGGILSAYICVADSTGNAPSSGGTAHASWNYMTKGSISGGFSSKQTFSSAGTHTYTKPTGITKIKVYITGGGASGAGGANSSEDQGGGGTRRVGGHRTTSLTATFRWVTSPQKCTHCLAGEVGEVSIDEAGLRASCMFPPASTIQWSATMAQPKHTLASLIKPARPTRYSFPATAGCPSSLQPLPTVVPTVVPEAGRNKKGRRKRLTRRKGTRK